MASFIQKMFVFFRLSSPAPYEPQTSPQQQYESYCDLMEQQKRERAEKRTKKAAVAQTPQNEITHLRNEMTKMRNELDALKAGFALRP